MEQSVVRHCLTFCCHPATTAFFVAAATTILLVLKCPVDGNFVILDPSVICNFKNEVHSFASLKQNERFHDALIWEMLKLSMSATPHKGAMMHQILTALFDIQMIKK